MQIAVLALQGDFEEHEQVFKNLNIKTCQIRQKKDLDQDFSAIVLPGGESTVQGKLLRSLDMFDKLKSLITNGLPVMATCAGTILLAEHILDDPTVHLGTMGITVKRNAYGRQLSSSHILGPRTRRARFCGCWTRRAPRPAHVCSASGSSIRF